LKDAAALNAQESARNTAVRVIYEGGFGDRELVAHVSCDAWSSTPTRSAAQALPGVAIATSFFDLHTIAEAGLRQIPLSGERQNNASIAEPISSLRLRGA
jgi:hypothetical protein